ncbi:MAG: HAD family hydrolase, partial [Patescibacteria group bacterium]|nr:HAD family hydrolase [Patescibacteria group bacterium]MDW8280054.1 HAD family hydrolase [bacterium]
KGINKSYGIKKISKNLKIKISDMAFIGDAIYPGGNDYSAKSTGILCIKVKGPAETQKLIEKIII